MATFKRSDIGRFLTDVTAGVILTAIELVRAGTGFGVLRGLGYAFFAASGSAVEHTLYVIPQSLVFRIVDAGAIAIPMFVTTSFPALFALGKLTAIQIIWGLAAPVVFLFIASG